MICSKCGGQWKYPVVNKRILEICSKCGFNSERNGSVDDVPFGPDSPIVERSMTLIEHLQAWRRGE